VGASRIGTNELRERVRDLLPELTELRHRLHSMPELGLEEVRTAELVRQRLSATGIELAPPYLKTDVVGLLRGRLRAEGEPACVLLRADLDALPLEEKREREWKSRSPGRAHACGHDGHTVMLLGAAAALAALSDCFAGAVRFVFQPGEEELAGGQRLIQRGLLEAPPLPSAAFALHGWPGLPEGVLTAVPGPAMAAADWFSIVIKGKGGHGAKPHTTIDPVVTAAQVITALQTIVSRNVNPAEPAVISVCTIQGGRATNVIPEQVRLEGTVRYFERDLKHLIRTRMEEVVRGTCEAAGAEAAFEYRDGYIPLVNDPGLVRFARRTVQAHLGDRAWLEGSERTMGAEDFAFYLERVPGALLLLGLGEGWPNLHSPEFDFNDRVLETGILTLAGLALDRLAA
jgi:hippurate hydrolase